MIFHSRLISRFIELLCANTLLMSKEKKMAKEWTCCFVWGAKQKNGKDLLHWCK